MPSARGGGESPRGCAPEPSGVRTVRVPGQRGRREGAQEAGCLWTSESLPWSGLERRKGENAGEGVSLLLTLPRDIKTYLPYGGE